MGRILEQWRIPAATLFSVALVVGAYVLARSVEAPSPAQASEELALLSAIAAKDSDGDGLPDWEEALYGTDPRTTDTFSLGMNDGVAVAKGLIVPKAIADIEIATGTPAGSRDIGYAVAGITAPADGSLTDAFAKEFFSLYLAAKQGNGGGGLSETQAGALAGEMMNRAAQSLTPAADFKTMRDITVSGTGTDAMRAYAVAVEDIFLKNTSSATTSELLYLHYAVENDDAAALARLGAIAKAYRDSAVGLAALAAPRELAAEHLALVNALARMSQIIGDFARVHTDPLTTMLALEQYVPAAQSLGAVFTDIGTAYRVAGVALRAGTPGASFVNLAADMAARQRAQL